MPNARRPAGPTNPTHTARDEADTREQVRDALDPAAPRAPHAHQPSREQPSPQPRNESPARRKDDNARG